MHLVAFSETSQTLTIYVESPPDAAGVEPDRPILGMITATPLLQEVIVIDANGEIRLPRPGPGV
ncbi:MAG: hypothetical protein E5V30_17825 [Mesorhizobium sp.]|nr:MAG: hypothetical protein E5V30_17825 [Mesorhizobium sp.]